MEIYQLTGKTITQHDRETQALPPRYRAEKLCLSFRDREQLYRRIDRRVDAMVSAGLFEEVEGLLREGLSPESTAMQAIGYKEAVQALEGSISRQEAVERIQLNSRRYAKRQLTWFGRDV
ncbi:MAG: tRNA (adenosine(37)-N6)-dimethylallyltransferase MiaA, partial [Bacteroidaceae bacterium]|nr:tRNA (adenosine(37)-N6)-dimethylallyltransferase MiaA [Bacteroidaceae bacterium]